MKKLSLLLIFCMGLSHICHSAECKYIPLTLQKILVNGNLRDYSDEWKTRNRAPMVLPSVGYNDSGVFIQCSYQLYDVEVQIKDESGNCLFDTIVDVQNEVYIELSEVANAEKYSIELIYGDCHLYGEFY